MTRNYSFIGKDTTIQGTITAEEVIVEGTVEGEINATNRILIRSGGKVDGPIQTRKILLEEGSIHNGSIKLDFEVNDEPEQKVTPKESGPQPEQKPVQSDSTSKEHKKVSQQI